MPLNISKIIQYTLKDNQYVQKDCSSIKNQIYIHHTAGGSNPYGVVDYWNATSERVATSFIIGGRYAPVKSGKVWNDGDILQAHASKYYSYHLYVASKSNKIDAKYKTAEHDRMLAEKSIGIEICNFGYITEKSGKFFNYLGTEVDKEDIVTYTHPFKGNVHYHKYTSAQVASLKDLLIYLCEKYNIPKTYNEDIWDITPRALSGQAGIYTHNAVRTDKSDAHYQPSLVNALKTLNFHTI